MSWSSARPVGELRRAALGAAAVVAALAVVAGCTGSPSQAPGPTAEQPSAGASPSEGATPTPTPPPSPKPTPTPTPTRAASNVPMKRLAPGENPPQFVIFSFDGAGWHDRWTEFREAAAQVDARFTGFLTGIYLLTDEHRDAYTGPGHPTGKASVSFGGDAATVTTLVGDLNAVWMEGHEIGTHYNGHFCADNPPGGGSWSTADWNSELDQFFGFWNGWQEIDGLQGSPPLQVPASEVKGGRTPCLEGNWDQIAPAWAAHGLTYDSSIPGSGIAWPKQEYGVWEFRMQTTSSPTLGSVMAMDYNFWYKFNKAKNQPERAPEIHAAVLETYRHMYTAAFTGNRAPVLVANHFNQWSGNAFNPAVKDFMLETCGKPETICATYQDVIAWMNLQDPAVLAELQARPAVY